MRHLVKKIKLQSGRDAKRALLRKLAYNFLLRGRLTTTQTKAKILKSLIEKIIQRTKEKNEANKNYLLHQFGNEDFLQHLFEKIGPNFKEIIGGYVRLTKLTSRESDGAQLARIEWSHPLLNESKNKKS